MLGTTIPLGDKNTLELHEHLIKETMKFKAPKLDSAGKPTVPVSVDFPEFLCLMSRLLDMNFAGIKEKIA